MLVPYSFLPTNYLQPLAIETSMGYRLESERFPGLEDEQHVWHPALIALPTWNFSYANVDDNIILLALDNEALLTELSDLFVEESVTFIAENCSGESTTFSMCVSLVGDCIDQSKERNALHLDETAAQQSEYALAPYLPEDMAEHCGEKLTDMWSQNLDESWEQHLLRTDWLDALHST